MSEIRLSLNDPVKKAKDKSIVAVSGFEAFVVESVDDIYKYESFGVYYKTKDSFFVITGGISEISADSVSFYRDNEMRFNGRGFYLKPIIVSYDNKKTWQYRVEVENRARSSTG